MDEPLAKVRENALLVVYELDPTVNVPEELAEAGRAAETRGAAPDTPGSAATADGTLPGESVVVETSALPPPPEPTPEPESLAPKEAAAENASVLGVPRPLLPLPKPMNPMAAQALACGYNRSGSGSFVVSVVHRSLHRSSSFFLNPFRQYLFGTPLLLRLPEGTTGRQLYRLVAGRVGHLLKEEARRRLAGHGDDEALALAPGGASSDALGAGRAAGLAPPVPPAEEARSGECAAVSDQEAHAGPIPAYGFRLREVSFDGMGDPKAHWLTRSVGRLIQPDDLAHACEDGACIAIDWHLAILKGWFDGSARFCLVHPSMASNQGMEDRALTLDKCLETFVAQEKISEAYCSKCKEHRNATLKTDFWRLPPVLVVHLKRFQFTAYSRRKLHNLVKFPVDALDLSSYLAQDDGGDETELSGRGSSYTLYAVVHHLGAMSSGHYVSSIRDRKTGQWHCFNDNIIVPSAEKEVVSESAYILFYVRNDMVGLNINDIYPSGPVDEDEMRKMLKKRDRNCSVM